MGRRRLRLPPRLLCAGAWLGAFLGLGVPETHAVVWERHRLVAAGPAHRLCVQVNLSFEPWPRAACAVLACDEGSVSLKGAGLLIQERAPAPFGDLL